MEKKSQSKPPTKPNVKKSKINQPQRKKNTKSSIIKKPSKQIAQSNLQPTKIIVETQQKQANWFVKIIKSLITAIIILLPIILIGGALWIIISKFFPEVATQFGEGATKIWVFIKDTCHNLDDKTKEWLEKIGINPKYSSIVSKALWFIGGFLLAGACFFISGIGPFLGKVVLFLAIAFLATVLLTDKTPPKAKTLPPNLVEVYDLDAIKATEEAKLKKELTEYAAKLSQEGKSSEEIKQKINQRIKKTTELRVSKQTSQ
ncbi:hypothetical protein M33023_03980 [Candidatus Phytoplasma asteris]|uniref:Uncharacterized protein n=1 Tax=Candidatus Phytoplasma asteris TaxID=85620 RepID=A0ABZ2YGA0_9MOLU